MSLLQSLTERLAAAFEEVGLDGSFGEVVVSQRPELAQFQCNGALPAAKTAERNPRQLAEDVIAAVDTAELIASLDVAGPGFINITLTDEAIARWVQTTAADERLGVPITSQPLNLVVDYGGPNVAKAMYVGHLRSTIIGDSLQRLARFVGHQVTTDIHFGDWGTQMGMLLVAVEESQPDLPYFDPDFSGDYPESSPVTLADLQELYPTMAARAREDAELSERIARATYELQRGRPGYRALWQHFVTVSQTSQRRDFHDLGVEFDLWYGESTVEDLIEPMIDRLAQTGVARQSQGALVVDVARESDKAEIPPLLLTKTDGAYLYSSTDVATIQMRVTRLEADAIWYVVDGRQALHFEQVFRAARKGGILPDGVAVEHIGFGTMNGPDGKPFQTRKGGVIRLADLIEMVKEAALSELDNREIASDYSEEERTEIATRVGLAALKYGDLSNQRTTNYIFDLVRFTSFEGKTGPYLLYPAVRTSSLLAKASEMGFSSGPIVAPSLEAERNLMLRLLRLPETILRTYETRSPNHLAEFAYEVASDINRFWESCNVLREPDPERRASWLTLVETSGRLLRQILDLLGIAVPERM